jgi:UDP-glucose 4-epimerase
MRSIVTGGSGFIGSHVVDELMRNGHEVAVLDIRKPHRPDVEFLEVDLTNGEAVTSAIRDCDYLFHLSAVSDLNSAARDPVYSAQVNVLGTINTLEAAKRINVKRFILASTAWVHAGSPDANPDERSPFYVPTYAPIYTSSKIASELFCHDYHKLFDQPFTILRYGSAYGPRMRAPLVVHAFLTKALEGETITIFGDGMQRRNFIYVEDLARAHSMILGNEALNQTYNVEGAISVSITEVAESIRDIMDQEVRIEYAPARSWDDTGTSVSIEKARVELGWQPQVGLAEGLARTINWYRERYCIG